MNAQKQTEDARRDVSILSEVSRVNVTMAIDSPHGIIEHIVKVDSSVLK